MKKTLYYYYLGFNNLKQVLCTFLSIVLQINIFICEYSSINFLGLGIDTILVDKSSGLRNVLLFFTLLVVSTVLTIILSYLQPFIKNNMATQMRIDFFESIAYKPYLIYNQKHGQWYELIVNQIDEFCFSACQIILKTVGVLTSTITIMIIMVNINVSIALILFCSCAIAAGLLMTIMKIALKTHEKRQWADREYSSIISENMDQLKMIKANQNISARIYKDSNAANKKFVTHRYVFDRGS